MPRKTTTRQTSDGRTAHIMAAAREVIAEKGYEKTLIADIAKRAGVVEGTIYRYFHNKRDLLIKVAEVWFSEQLTSDSQLDSIQGVQNKLQYLAWRTLSIIKREPDDRTVHWIWSAEGHTGKSTFMEYLTIKYGAIQLGDKPANAKHGIVTYINDMGAEPECILFHIPRSVKTDYLSYEGIECAKDMFFTYKGGQVCGNCPHVFVFANIPPDESMMAGDRWNIWQIDGPWPGDFPH